ncbi:hypothetical protein [Gordonia sp. VNK21]|uniref:hypothetical protein n=1 Tax=Gordonia sp. VNK21 TaxID=3382483 RepID=UPI0038D449ED
MKIPFRRAAAATAMTAALVAGAALGAPAATAAPTGEALAAKTALDRLNPQPQDAADALSTIEAANALLTKLGITPFTPTIGACTDFSFPAALGGAIAGPKTPLLGDLSYTVLGKHIDINAVKKGEILYGFVPVGTFNDSGDKRGMQVAWFNVNTFEGSIGEPMDGLGETIVKAVTKRLEEANIPRAAKVAEGLLTPVTTIIPSNGVRGGLVDTGSGTVLSAIYGSINKGDATCYFFPSLGIATAK